MLCRRSLTLAIQSYAEEEDADTERECNKEVWAGIEGSATSADVR